MRIEQLEYFAEAAKYHSISIAADKLFVSQPAVSIAIKNLENELGCILFERSKNGLVLTKIGHKVLKKCETILKEEKSIYQLVEGEKKARRALAGRIKRFGYSHAGLFFFERCGIQLFG